MENKITIEIPAGMTEERLLALLTRPQKEPKDTESKSDRHCWRGNPCGHWVQTGEQAYIGYCKAYSVTCSTAIFNKSTLTRWVPKKP